MFFGTVNCSRRGLQTHKTGKEIPIGICDSRKEKAAEVNQRLLFFLLRCGKFELAAMGRLNRVNGEITRLNATPFAGLQPGLLTPALPAYPLSLRRVGSRSGLF